MKKIPLLPLFLVALALLFLAPACGLSISGQPAPTATIKLITATLPPTYTPFPTETPPPPTAAPTIVPVEGITTTQVYVRAAPSTQGPSLGLLPASSKVQVIGKAPGNQWYQILYEGGKDGKGWVAAQFVLLPAGAEIPLIGAESGSGSGVSGVVLQKLNVRSGPGTSFNSLGMLNPQDVVTLTGKNASGTWLQIEYPAGPNGKGWVTAAYIQIKGNGELPIVGETGEIVGTGTPTSIPPTSTATRIAAPLDHDSKTAPLARVTFTANGTRSFLFTGDVSAPQGDGEDWIEFTPDTANVTVEIVCLSGTLSAEIWQGDTPVLEASEPACDLTKTLTVLAGQPYLVHVWVKATAGELQYARYTLHVSSLP